MFKIAVCDDDADFLKHIKSVIERDPLFNADMLVNTYTSGMSLLSSDLEHLSLVTIDMQMNGMSGYETARELRKINSRCVLAFCSAVIMPQPEHFDVQPYRYLIKQTDSAEFNQKIDELLEEMKRRDSCMFIEAVSDGKAERISISEILYIEKMKRGSSIKISSKLQKLGLPERIISREKLESLYDILKNEGFSMPHKSFIVNLKKIIQIDSDTVLMEDGTRISVTRSCSKVFHAEFAQFFSSKYRRTLS